MTRHAKWRRVDPQSRPVAFLMAGVTLLGFVVMFAMALIGAWIVLSG